MLRSRNPTTRIIVKRPKEYQKFQVPQIENFVSQMRPEHNIGILIEPEIAAERLGFVPEEEVRDFVDGKDIKGK